MENMVSNVLLPMIHQASYKVNKANKAGRGSVCGGWRGPHQHSLPNALLSHVLSFLPAEEAIGTCLVARRWRHLWKFTAGVHFGCLWGDEPKSVHELQRFVEYFLLLRGCSPLNTCELRIGGFSGIDDVPRVNLWFQHAVMCRVRLLILHIYRNDYYDPWLELDDLPLVSKTLTKLELHGARCHASFLNFSSCPAFENLCFEYFDFSLTMKISSGSIKSLSIIDSTLGDDSRVRISVPNLVSLKLDSLWDNTSILETMPALTEAFVRIAEFCDDRCIKMFDPYQNCNCEACESSDSIGKQSNNCVLLEGLSKARSLVLISRPDVVSVFYFTCEEVFGLSFDVLVLSTMKLQANDRYNICGSFSCQC